MSKVKIRCSNQALENLTDLAQYWAGIAPRRARAAGRAIMDKITLLADFPELGKPIEGLPSVYRETFVDDYRILYKRIEDTHILLIAIRTRQAATSLTGRNRRSGKAKMSFLWGERK